MGAFGEAVSEKHPSQQMIQANEVLMDVGMKLKFSYPWHKIIPTKPWKQLVEAEDCFYRYTTFIFLTITQ